MPNQSDVRSGCLSNLSAGGGHAGTQEGFCVPLSLRFCKGRCPVLQFGGNVRLDSVATAATFWMLPSMLKFRRLPCRSDGRSGCLSNLSAAGVTQEFSEVEPLALCPKLLSLPWAEMTWQLIRLLGMESLIRATYHEGPFMRSMACSTKLFAAEQQKYSASSQFHRLWG